MENNHHDDDLQPGNDDTLLARWLAGDLSPEDLEALRNLEGFPEYVEMLHNLEGLEMDEYSPTLAWQKLQPILEKEKAEKEVGSSTLPIAIGSEQSVSAELETTAETPEIPAIAHHPEAKIIEIPQPSAVPTIVNRKSQIVNPKWLAIAAALLIGVVGIWWFSGRDNFSFTDTAYVTKAGENKEVKLPDGSVVTLNAMSKLGFAEVDWQDGRKVGQRQTQLGEMQQRRLAGTGTRQGGVEAYVQHPGGSLGAGSHAAIPVAQRLGQLPAQAGGLTEVPRRVELVVGPGEHRDPGFYPWPGRGLG